MFSRANDNAPVKDIHLGWRLLRAVIVVATSGWLLVSACERIPLFSGEALFKASVSQDYEGMKCALAKGANVDFKFDGGDDTVLASVIENDDPRAAAILLNHGASTSALSRHYENLLGRSPFAHKVSLERLKVENRPGR